MSQKTRFSACAARDRKRPELVDEARRWTEAEVCRQLGNARTSDVTWHIYPAIDGVTVMEANGWFVDLADLHVFLLTNPQGALVLASAHYDPDLLEGAQR